jgi:uncharacterized OB-fold protein
MPARPIPQTTPETAPFWEAARNGELRLPKCESCGRLHYPPQARCPNCLSEALKWIKLSGRCKLRSWTTVHLPSVPGVEPPFTICEAELAEQSDVVLVAHLVGVPETELTIGCEMAIRFGAAGNGVAYPQIERPSFEARSP